MLDADSPVPLYQQVKTALRRAVQSGMWAPGEAIPPERELVERFKVSRITVRQALADLVAEGLLFRQHGRGTFVAARRPEPIAETLTDLTGHLEELRLRGLDPEIHVLSLERRLMPPEVVRALERERDAEGWYLFRLVRVEGQPLMLTEVFLPGDLQIPMRLEDVQREGLAPLLSGWGHPPVRGLQRIAACGATPEQADLLGVLEGDALLRVTRVMFDSGDKPLTWLRTHYRADRYEYEVALKRRR